MKKRLSLLVIVAFGLTAIAMLSLTVGVSEGQVPGGQLIISVDVDEASFDAPLGLPGPFNVSGDTGSGAGSFQCWGWIFGDGVTTNVSQRYKVAGRGEIMTQGREGVPLALVGGTGDFSNARGEASQVFTGDGLNFDLVVNLTGAGR